MLGYIDPGISFFYFRFYCNRLCGHDITDKTHKSKLTLLYNHLHRNQAYTVNYENASRLTKPIVILLLNHILIHWINARHKERTKCNGLEKVLRSALQIRAVMASGEWVTNGKSSPVISRVVAYYNPFGYAFVGFEDPKFHRG